MVGFVRYHPRITIYLIMTLAKGNTFSSNDPVIICFPFFAFLYSFQSRSILQMVGFVRNHPGIMNFIFLRSNVIMLIKVY